MSSLPNCLCAQTPEEKFKVNCDHVVFHQDFPSLPFRQPIVSFSLRHVNAQNIPPQVMPIDTLTIKISPGTLLYLYNTL
jgi:hypothetical protein